MACVFCGKQQHEVKKMVDNGQGVLLCSECIGTCASILWEEDGTIEDFNPFVKSVLNIETSELESYHMHIDLASGSRFWVPE